MVRICFGFPFSSKVVVCGHCLVSLPLTINETLKWLSSLPILMQESFRWWQCSDRYNYNLPLPAPPYRPPPPPPTFSPTLISLMVSEDIITMFTISEDLAQCHWGKLCLRTLITMFTIFEDLAQCHWGKLCLRTLITMFTIFEDLAQYQSEVMSHE